MFISIGEISWWMDWDIVRAPITTNPFDFAQMARVYSVVPFDLQELLNGNNIAEFEQVVSMEVKDSLGCRIKGRYTTCEFCQLVIKWT